MPSASGPQLSQPHQSPGRRGSRGRSDPGPGRPGSRRATRDARRNPDAITRRNLVLAGKGLAGAGLTGIVGYMAATAAQRSWPPWPYWAFTGLLLAGVILYLAQQRPPAGPSAGKPGPQPGPAFTGLWRQTANAAEVLTLGVITRKSFSHHGYEKLPSGEGPPSVRISVIVVSDPLGPTPTTSDLRDNFLSFLRQPPAWNLVKSLTHVGDDLAWRSYAGDGRLNNEAVLTYCADQEEAPAASAMMFLNEHGMPPGGHDPRIAGLLLHIEPRGPDGKPAPLASFQACYDGLVRALALPEAFGQFLSRVVGVTTYAEPAQFGVELRARQSISELIDCGGLQPVAGSSPTNTFTGYMLAERAGRQAADVAVDLLTSVCDHALHLQNGYEYELARLLR